MGSPYSEISPISARYEDQIMHLPPSQQRFEEAVKAKESLGFTVCTEIDHVRRSRKSVLQHTAGPYILARRALSVAESLPMTPGPVACADRLGASCGREGGQLGDIGGCRPQRNPT
jgi:hypothetical protein